MLIIVVSMSVISCGKKDESKDEVIMNPKANKYNQEGLQLFSQGKFDRALDKFILAEKENPKEYRHKLPEDEPGHWG